MAANSFFQTSWVVHDLDAAVQSWLDTTSAGPFFVIPHAQVTDPRYLGRPSGLDTSVAMAQAGAMQIELVQQHDDGPSAYRDSVPAGQDGMHHIGGLTDDLDAELARYRAGGVRVPYEGTFGDVRFAYFDTRSSIGCMTELVERRPAFEGLLAMIADASRGWDGSDPVRGL